MARDNYSLQKTKLQKEISRLQKKMQGLDEKQRSPKIAAIVKTMKEFDISLEEISVAFNKTGRGKSTLAGSASGKRRSSRPAAIRYRHPVSGETWTGRGRAPRWLAAAEAAGQNREQFRVQPAAAPAEATPAVASGQY